MKKTFFSVISSFAQDHIQQDGKYFVRDGGPALFICDSLKKLEVPFELFSGSGPCKTEIEIIHGVERGTFASACAISLTQDVRGDAVIISTLLDEFPLEACATIRGAIGIDLQGYVRKEKKEQKKFSVDPQIARCWKVVKVTAAEAAMTDPDILADQKQRVLIVTDGSSPVQIWERGNFFELTPKKIEVRNSLGAGDRFLTAFMVASQAGSSIRSAGEFALEHVGRILENQLDTRNTRANLANTFDTP